MPNDSDFWSRVDSLNPYPTLAELISRAELDYNLIKRQRFDNRVPKTADAYRIAKVLNTSIEYLLTGTEPQRLPDRIGQNMLNATEFWDRVDKNNPYKTVGKLVAATGINYHRLTQQRCDGIMPKADDLYKISIAIGKSMEFLLTGNEKPAEKIEKELPERIKRIVFRLENLATEEDFMLVERILRLPYWKEENQDAECY